MTNLSKQTHADDSFVTDYPDDQVGGARRYAEEGATYRAGTAR